MTDEELLIFQPGHIVRVLEGPFAGYAGPIVAIDGERRKVRVRLTLYGQGVPANFDLLQVALYSDAPS